jgi:hypothetical protein
VISEDAMATLGFVKCSANNRDQGAPRVIDLSPGLVSHPPEDIGLQIKIRWDARSFGAIYHVN